jgi:hypothetical protein
MLLAITQFRRHLSPGGKNGKNIGKRDDTQGERRGKMKGKWKGMGESAGDRENIGNIDAALVSIHCVLEK